MRSRRYISQNTESSNYDLSISDLMAALCCVFIIIMVATTGSLLKEKDFLTNTAASLQKELAALKVKNKTADAYRATQHDLFIDLNKEFKDDLSRWHATIDPDTLSIRFSSDAGFRPRSATLNPNYKNILNEFFPKLVKILKKREYKNIVEEVRIEGFTAPDVTAIGGAGSENDYIEGIKLSQERTKNVLLYCLENTNYTTSNSAESESAQKKWVRNHIVSNGYSLTRPLNRNNTICAQGDKIDKAKTRRVEFRIKTNDNEVIKKLEGNTK